MKNLTLQILKNMNKVIDNMKKINNKLINQINYDKNLKLISIQHNKNYRNMLIICNLRNINI